MANPRGIGVQAWAPSERHDRISNAVMPGFRASLAAYDALLVLREEVMSVEGTILPLATMPGQTLCTAGMSAASSNTRTVLRAPAGSRALLMPICVLFIRRDRLVRASVMLIRRCSVEDARQGAATELARGLQPCADLHAQTSSSIWQGCIVLL